MSSAAPAENVDPLAFRRTMGLFATGVTVLATDTPKGIVAMTANAISSVSLVPPLVLACVDHQARFAAYLADGLSYTINFLRDDQEVLSRYFAGGWRDLPAPEFRFEPWSGAPRLVGALGAVRCEMRRVSEGGDHWIVVGRVVALHEGVAPWNPLLFYAGRYRRLAPATPTAPPERWGPDGVALYHDTWDAQEQPPVSETREPPE